MNITKKSEISCQNFGVDLNVVSCKKTYKSKKELSLLIQKFYQFFGDTNINFILFYGSLLGFIREKHFIDNDDDIDFLFSKEDLPIIFEIIKKYNLKYIVHYRDGIIGIIQVYFDKLGPLDLYVYEDYQKKGGDDILIRWDGNLLFSKVDIFPLKQGVFRGIKIFYPKNSPKILEEIYGKDWVIPVSKKDYKWNDITQVRRVN